MASVKAQKPIGGSTLFGQVKKEPVKASEGASKPAPKKAEQKPQPKKKSLFMNLRAALVKLERAEEVGMYLNGLEQRCNSLLSFRKEKLIEFEKRCVRRGKRLTTKSDSLNSFVVNSSIIGTKEIVVLIEKAKFAKKKDLQAAHHQEFGRKYMVGNNGGDVSVECRGSGVENVDTSYSDEERTETDIEHEPQRSRRGECTDGGREGGNLVDDLDLDGE
ncbi:hypothetical protein GIB67_041920 [Kingdonia uniflora]|uniref:Uncharacterized protein n=1 Tax=Kingdonia uniflora TaxID=39325 RepID=A0A7J7N155_9MAGN|nr:hypothetical protein GIB67_041920 [Kingdonia uniflora]